MSVHMCPAGSSGLVFENSTGIKNSEGSESVAFYKIRQNLEKFDQNAFEERKKQKIFKNTKIGQIG
jgi:hypothetical protein